MYPSLDSLAAEFHKQNPSITVQMIILPDDYAAWESEDWLSLASAADATFLFYDRARLAQNGAYFSDLMPLMEGDVTFQPDDFWPGLLTACQDNDDRTLGVLLSVFFSGIFFDPAAFDSAGLPNPAPGWTWNDFQQAVTTLAHKSGEQADYGFIDSSGFFSSVLAPQVDAYLVTTNGVIEAETLANQLQWYLDLAGASSLYPFTDPAHSQALFQGKSPAMWRGTLADTSPVASRSYRAWD